MSVIQNPEKVDTCQLEIQKHGTPVKDRLVTDRRSGRSSVFRFEIPGSRSLLLSLSQAEISENGVAAWGLARSCFHRSNSWCLAEFGDFLMPRGAC